MPQQSGPAFTVTAEVNLGERTITYTFKSDGIVVYTLVMEAVDTWTVKNARGEPVRTVNDYHAIRDYLNVRYQGQLEPIAELLRQADLPFALIDWVYEFALFEYLDLHQVVTRLDEQNASGLASELTGVVAKVRRLLT